jgi:hypothetical protein
MADQDRVAGVRVQLAVGLVDQLPGLELRPQAKLRGSLNRATRGVTMPTECSSTRASPLQIPRTRAGCSPSPAAKLRRAICTTLIRMNSRIGEKSRPPMAGKHAAERRHDGLRDLVHEIGRRVGGARCDPAEDDHAEQGKKVDLHHEADHRDHGPGDEQARPRQGQAVHQQHDDDTQQLDEDGKQEGRGIDASPGRQDAAQGHDQRIGRAHQELADRVVEVGEDELQNEAHHHDQQVDADRCLHEVERDFVDRGHVPSVRGV